MSTRPMRSTMSENRRFEVGPRICHCGNQCRLTTSWTDNNPGRRFWGCADYGVRRGCAFFEWYDPQVCERSKIVICGLLKRLRKEEEENRKLKIEVGAGLKARRFLLASVLGSWIFLIVLLGMLVLEWRDAGSSKNVKLALQF
ncbi:uncharacterized protein LOC110773532 [Prunus avium]|uniref:Uncharacterized protein LOC110773532 n=1 Tax=Prunus avium TaxID=42229 RepID=A0A6P5U364_PRUAV|nr:uncharacterized protein LOC110773532 [Prunus avium]